MARGHTVVLSSSALTVQVEPVARFLGIQNVLSNKFETDEHGRLTGEVLTPIIYAEALELIEAHKAAGRKTVIISSSPIETVQPLGEHLGVDDVIATRARLDENGRYKGTLKPTGVRPKFAEKLADQGIRLGPEVFNPNSGGAVAQTRPAIGR